MSQPAPAAWPASRTSDRIGGVLLLAGGIALGGAFVLVALAPLGPGSVTPSVGLAMIVAAALLLPGLPAFYAVQAARTGVSQAVAQGTLMIGLLLLVVVSATPVLHPEAHLDPGESPVLFLLAVALLAGLILTSVQTARAGVLPRGAAIGLLVGAFGFGFAFFVAELTTPLAGQIGSAVAGVLLGGSFAWLGAAVWNQG